MTCGCGWVPMAEAKRETRTVETTVTVLELSVAEVTALADTLTTVFNRGMDLPPEVHDIRDALKGAADQAAPLSVGDTIRVLWGSHSGSVVRVLRVGEHGFTTNTAPGAMLRTWTWSFRGEDDVWERVSA